MRLSFKLARDLRQCLQVCPVERQLKYKSNRCVSRHLKPVYGWTEQVELDIYPRCDDGSLPGDAALFAWANYLFQASEMTGKPIAYNVHTRQMLQNAGFTQVSEEVIRVPFHAWPENVQDTHVGMWFSTGLVQWLEALSLGPLMRVLQWDRARVDKLLADVRREILHRKYHIYCEMHVWTGRRPA